MSASSLTVLGDSFVEGRGDPSPSGGYRGWVPRFAGQMGLRGSRVRNLGAFQATTSNVVDLQLQIALSIRSPLVGVVVGVNDLVSAYDAATFERNLHRIFGELRDTGATVFTATYPDIPARLPVPDGFRELLRTRFVAANAVLNEVAVSTGTQLLDIAESDEWTQPEMWTPDGLHPSPMGHKLFASGTAELVSRATATTIAA